MSQNDPCDPTVLQLSRTDLSGESTIGFVEDILSCNLNVLVEVLAAEQQVKSWGCNDNLGLVVELGSVQAGDNIVDRLDRAVPRSQLVLVKGALDRVLGAGEYLGTS